MPPRRKTYSQAEIAQLIAQGVAEAMAARQPNSGSEDASHNTSPAIKPCTYKDFLNCKPLDFRGTEGAIGLLRWFEKMESVFRISNCTEDSKVKFATCTLLDGALTWWNSYTHSVGIDTAYLLPWEDLKNMLTEEYCPNEELQKLEEEFWHLTVEGTDIISYTTRFQQLALFCPSMVDTEQKRIRRYIRGLPESIQGNVASSKPATIQSAIRLAHELMAMIVRRESSAQTSNNHNKRKWDGVPDNTNTEQQLAVRAYAIGTDERGYRGSKPFCSQCDSHHEGPCGAPCNRCQSRGHQTKDCRVKVCFECGNAGHFHNACPQLNNARDRA